MLVDDGASLAATEKEERRVRGIGHREETRGFNAEELGGGKLGRQAHAEEEVIQPRHQARQRRMGVRLRVDIALQQGDEDGCRQAMAGDVGYKQVHDVVLQEVVVEVAGQRLAGNVRRADLDAGCAEARRRDEGLLIVQLAELVLVGLDAQQCPQAGQEDLRVGAFRHEIVRAGVESLDDVLRVVGAGEHQNGDGLQGRIALDPPGHLEPIHTRHAVVDDDCVGGNGLGLAQAVLARDRAGDDESHALQEASRDLQIVSAVVDDDDALRLRLRHRR